MLNSLRKRLDTSVEGLEELCGLAWNGALRLMESVVTTKDVRADLNSARSAVRVQRTWSAVVPRSKMSA